MNNTTTDGRSPFHFLTLTDHSTMFSIVFLVCPMVMAWPQINLHLTDALRRRDEDTASPHDCLHTAAWMSKDNDAFVIVSYCVDQRSPRRTSPRTSHVTFDELRQGKISIDQSSLWSPPIDVIERYQFYLHVMSLRQRLIRIAFADV